MHEEMRRVIAATHHRAREWNLLRSQRQTQTTPPFSLLDEDLEEGLVAYADEHAHMESMLAAAFEAKWEVIQQKAREYLTSTTPDRLTTRGRTTVNATAQGESGADVDTTEVVHVEIEVASEVEDSEGEDE